MVHSQPGVDRFTVHESVAAEIGATAPPESTPIAVRVSSSAMRADVERLDALIWGPAQASSIEQPSRPDAYRDFGQVGCNHVLIPGNCACVAAS